MMDYAAALRFALTPGELPREFDASFYKDMHEDLVSLTDEALQAHFDLYGKWEGRIASPAAHRIPLISTIPLDASVLEIGPAVRPALRRANVKYFDVADRQGLIERAVRENYDVSHCPEVIHYVSENGDLGAVQEKFDVVFSSHCIEHQPDLVAHLQNVERILNPGGRYYLCIPDKRYCFDSLIDASSLEEILLAFAEKRKVHTLAKVIEHHAFTTHNDPSLHWRGHHDDPHFSQRGERITRGMQTFEASMGSYVDVHAWQFTPTSFRGIISALNEAKLSKLLPERVYDTVLDRNEFTAVLRSS